MPNYDEMIGKSLDELEQISNQYSTEEEDTEGEVSKAQSDNTNPDNISDNTPVPEESEGDEGEEDESVDEAGEQEDDTEEYEADDEDEHEEGEEEEETEKSLEDHMRSDDNVKKALEVSEFLDSLVKSLSETIQDQREDLNKSLEAQEQHNELLAKSFKGIAESQKVVLQTSAGLLKSVDSLSSRIKKIERQPKTRKSMPSAKAIEKSFNTEDTNSGSEQNSQKLDKSMALSKLTNAVQKGEGNYTSDILALESTGDFNSISNEARSYLNIN